MIGLLCSICGGLVVGLAFYIGVTLASAQPEVSSNQMYLVALGGAAGLIGSIIDSILGATLQVNSLRFHGLAVACGVRGPGLSPSSFQMFFLISGIRW